MKEIPKWLKISFWLSLIPFALWLGYAVYFIVFGSVWFTQAYYGLEGFQLGLITGALIVYVFPFVIPILIACIVIQILYIVERVRLKKRGEIGLGRMTKRTAAILLSILGAAVLAGVAYSFRGSIQIFIEKRQAVSMSERADFSYEYNKSVINVDGIFGLEQYPCDTLFIDCDSMKVGFLTSSSYDQYNEFRLTKLKTSDLSALEEIKRELPVQAVISIDSCGSRLITFCEKETQIHGRTQAMIVETADRGTWYTASMNEKKTGYSFFSGLDSSDAYVGEGVYYSTLTGGMDNE